MWKKVRQRKLGKETRADWLIGRRIKTACGYYPTQRNRTIARYRIPRRFKDLVNDG
jgi:hypothetical protein